MHPDNCTVKFSQRIRPTHSEHPTSFYSPIFNHKQSRITRHLRKTSSKKNEEEYRNKQKKKKILEATETTVGKENFKTLYHYYNQRDKIRFYLSHFQGWRNLGFAEPERLAIIQKKVIYKIYFTIEIFIYKVIYHTLSVDMQ